LFKTGKFAKNMYITTGMYLKNVIIEFCQNPEISTFIWQSFLF